jgi:hypothetical protein
VHARTWTDSREARTRVQGAHEKSHTALALVSVCGSTAHTNQQQLNLCSACQMGVKVARGCGVGVVGVGGR